ncbi:MAG: hypothetical protein KJ077_05225 [Anaerolineae bacterium]|nr:hypothetical protein [Anaerolineae bacterium]
MIPRFQLVVLILTLATLACIRIDLSPPSLSQPVIAALPPPVVAPTAIVQPTLPAAPVTYLLPTPPIKAIPEPVCLQPELAAGEHIAASGSYTETERSASTPMLCHLERNSCGYNQLVGIVDPTIVYKREEAPPYDMEDILVHPAMIPPLARLNQLIQAEWGGAYQLRVSDAYDSLLEHDPPESKPATRYSLHYEGRAIDLTLWPVDQSKYGRLCALAHCAGFDWVLDEGTHCHASIRAESLCLACQQ